MRFSDQPRSLWRGAALCCRRTISAGGPEPWVALVAREVERLLTGVREMLHGPLPAARSDVESEALRGMERLQDLGVLVSRCGVPGGGEADAHQALVVLRSLLQALVDGVREGWSAGEIGLVLDTTLDYLRSLHTGGPDPAD